MLDALMTSQLEL